MKKQIFLQYISVKMPQSTECYIQKSRQYLKYTMLNPHKSRLAK